LGAPSLTRSLRQGWERPELNSEQPRCRRPKRSRRRSDFRP
jgi:hypothetical protein